MKRDTITIRVKLDLHSRLKSAAALRQIPLESLVESLLTASIAKERGKKQTPAAAFGGDA